MIGEKEFFGIVTQRGRNSEKGVRIVEEAVGIVTRGEHSKGDLKIPKVTQEESNRKGKWGGIRYR